MNTKCDRCTVHSNSVTTCPDCYMAICGPCSTISGCHCDRDDGPDSWIWAGSFNYDDDDDDDETLAEVRALKEPSK